MVKWNDAAGSVMLACRRPPTCSFSSVWPGLEAVAGSSPAATTPKRLKSNGGMIAVSDLQAVKKLVDALGSIQRAQSTIAALARLQ